MVQKGRQAHEERRRINPNYLRKKLGVVEAPVRRAAVVDPAGRAGLGGRGAHAGRRIDGPFRLQVRRGSGPRLPQPKDAIGALRPVDPRNLSVPCSPRVSLLHPSKHKVVPIEFRDADFAEAESLLPEILQVIQTGCFPQATSWKARCRDCCYRNICIK